MSKDHQNVQNGQGHGAGTLTGWAVHNIISLVHGLGGGGGGGGVAPLFLHLSVYHSVPQ